MSARWYWLLALFILLLVLLLVLKKCISEDIGNNLVMNGGSVDDIIKTQVSTTGEFGILIDGDKNGAFQNDDRFTGQLRSDLRIGNYVPSTTPHKDEIIAFIPGYPPILMKSPPYWSVNSDPIPIPSLPHSGKPPLPIYVWIVNGDFTSQVDLASRSVAKAQEIWDKEEQGLILDVVNPSQKPEDATHAPGGTPRPDLNVSWMGNDAANLVAEVGSKPNVINVYYVHAVKRDARGLEPALPTNGTYCTGVSGTFIILVGSDTGEDILAHELGHELSLGHVTDYTEEFDQTNVMHEDSSSRKFLTEGQKFRTVVNSDSALIRLGILPAQNPPRDCPPLREVDVQAEKGWALAKKDVCPVLEKRIWADGRRGPN